MANLSFLRCSSRVGTLLAGSGLGLLLTGCAMEPVAPSNAVTGLSISGKVRGGNQPVSGATVQLFTPGSTGYGSASVAVSLATTTDSGGNFSIAQPLTCPSSSSLVYMRASGGNPGLGSGTNNAQIAEMVALGKCGNLSPTTFVVISELTTVAAVWSLAPFMTDSLHVGTSATNAAGLQGAFVSASQLASSSVAGGPGTLAANVTAPTAELNTLANVLASCVNSVGGVAGDGSACGKVLAAATPAGGTAPTDTAVAGLNMALHPGLNVATLYNLVATNGPFQPTLTAAPNDWTVTLALAAPVLAANAYLDVAIDSTQNVWVSYGAGTTNGVLEYGQDFTLASPAGGFTDSSLNGPYTLAFDLTGNLWLPNSYDVTLTEFAANGSFLKVVTGGGMYGPSELAFDKFNNVWVANFGVIPNKPRKQQGVSEFTNAGVALSPAAGYGGGGAAYQQYDLATTPAGNVWIGGEFGLAELAQGGTAVSPNTYGFGGAPCNLALDAQGNVWTSYYGSAGGLRLYSSAGVLTGTFTGGGLNGGFQAVAVDGVGNVWLANDTYTDGYGATYTPVGTLSEFSSAGVALSGSTGFAAGTGGAIWDVIDSSGNIWFAQTGELYKTVGVAAPVVTPLSVATATGKLGSRP